ncbi:Pex25p NDAI_0E02520 [Naumovozyma dairenensis CBS 421]|uniref:Uncharacterized protein n=1 Tax=Naumovozyma dairenensis (strain ATCC 10597 / BCRC 20456 / CBS 421 / NBRC 0211 / NRRL Y-12639) TaxID=1071378 RepID=G0WBE9_NAUDC|nr:hypothetical protein NDAI_0E02520 [Naumovozyma dairenensis CBS 421]CCD25069.1 hypothetical protein NDAI_0E02520 [Naumovozyma dairenensis CBS 421]
MSLDEPGLIIGNEKGNNILNPIIKDFDDNNLRLPISLNQVDPTKNDSELTLLAATNISPSSSPELNIPNSWAKPESKIKKVVRNVDILKYLINSLAGKDKFVKIIKCILDLLKSWILTDLSSTETNIKMKKLLLSLSTTSSGTSIIPLKSILVHPVKFVRLFTLSFLQNLNHNVSFITSQLSIFRYMIRFGSSPFKLLTFVKKLRSTTKATNLNDIEKLWLNEKSLQDSIDLYYTIFDELDLLYKLKIWNPQERTYSWVTKHETIAWQYDILLSWKQNWFKLKDIQRKILELQIQLKIRNDTMLASNYFNNNNNSNDNTDNTSPLRKQLISEIQQNGNNNDLSSLEIELDNQLVNLNHEKRIVYLDLTRLSFDCLANTTDLLNIKTPKGTYAALSLCSGITGFIKLWINTKTDLQNGAQ